MQISYEKFGNYTFHARFRSDRIGSCWRKSSNHSGMVYSSIYGNYFLLESRLVAIISRAGDLPIPLIILFSILSLIIMFAIVGLILRFIKNITDKNDSLSNLNKTPKWLQEIISKQSQNIPLSIKGRYEYLDFTNIETTEPYIKVVIELTNVSVFTFNGLSFDGNIKIDGIECSRPEVTGLRILPFPSDQANIIIKQKISSETARKLINVGHEISKIKLDMRNLLLYYPIETEGFEGRAIIKLSELDVIPKGIVTHQLISKELKAENSLSSIYPEELKDMLLKLHDDIAKLYIKH